MNNLVHFFYPIFERMLIIENFNFVDEVINFVDEVINFKDDEICSSISDFN